MNKLPILMTASVSTRGMVGADFADEDREKMYLETIGFYVEELLSKDLSRKIVFAENSGWNMGYFKSKIKNLPAGRVEFLSLDPKSFDISKGKGYNELILINQAIERSCVLREAGAFMKVTGRYPVYNLHYFLQNAEWFIFERGGKFYGDIKDHSMYDLLFPNNTSKWNGHAAYTVLFASTTKFYQEELGPLYDLCNDYKGRWVECVWYDALAKYRREKDSGVSLRFKREPVCGGLQGSSAQTIAFSKDNLSFKSRLMRLVGNCIRICMPWFWF